MHSHQKWFFWLVVVIIVNLIDFAHAQNNNLPDASKQLTEAPKQIRFYANQLKSNLEKIKTLKGEISRLFHTPVTTAVFYRDRGNQLGIEESTVAGDFIREDLEVYRFTWDLASDNVVSISVPNTKPCRYIDAKTNKEVVPEFKNSLIGDELKTVVNSQYAISTAAEKRTVDGRHQVYERTQNNFHKLRGSPKEVFYWDSDLPYHEFLFNVAKQLQEEGAAAGTCYLSTEKDLHILDLIANSKTGHALTYKWVFDASHNFVLTKYECKIGEKNNTTTHEWTYSFSNPAAPVPMKKTTTIIDSDGRRQYVFDLSKLVVNEDVADDTFSLTSLGPSNGDILFDKESGEKFVIQDSGRNLVSTDRVKGGRSTNMRLVYIAINVALVLIIVGLLVLRRRMRRGVGA